MPEPIPLVPEELYKRLEEWHRSGVHGGLDDGCDIATCDFFVGAIYRAVKAAEARAYVTGCIMGQQFLQPKTPEQRAAFIEAYGVSLEEVRRLDDAAKALLKAYGHPNVRNIRVLTMADLDVDDEPIPESGYAHPCPGKNGRVTVYDPGGYMCDACGQDVRPLVEKWKKGGKR